MQIQMPNCKHKIEGSVSVVSMTKVPYQCTLCELEALRAERDRMRPVVEAALRWDDVDLDDTIDGLQEAINTYRAATKAAASVTVWATSESK